MIKGIFILDKLTKEKIDKAVDLGVDAIFIGHKNLKKSLIEKLRDKNIKIYSEIGLFAGEELWRKYPDARPIERNGRPMEKIDWYAGVCPNHPQIRKKSLQLIKSIINKFDVDGIWLDFIRYPCHWEIINPDLTEYCFCPNCLNKLRKDMGIAHFSARQPEWTRWKCDQITNFVADVHNLIDKSSKNIQLGMFSVPWREKDFGGAITKIIGQDFKSLARFIDVFSPMVYHKMCGRITNWIHDVVVYMDETTGKPILPIIQTEDKPEKILGEEFRKEIEEALKKPSQGAIVFFLEDLLKDRNKTKIVKEIFK